MVATSCRKVKVPMVREKGDCGYTKGEFMLPSFLSAKFYTDLAVLLISRGARQVGWRRAALGL